MLNVAELGKLFKKPPGIYGLKWVSCAYRPGWQKLPTMSRAAFFHGLGQPLM